MISVGDKVLSLRDSGSFKKGEVYEVSEASIFTHGAIIKIIDYEETGWWYLSGFRKVE